ncbi:MAG: Ig-like domain-containing protein [Clostridium sp.]|nr:Ig-like domain-containing protein [Clostridium sp.]
MKKAKNKKTEKIQNVSEDTLEFLSLDDEFIEEYTQKAKSGHGRRKKPVRKPARNLKKRDVYEEDEWDEDDYETEELEDIEEVEDEEDEEDDEEYYEIDEEDDDEEYYEIDDEDEEDDEYYEMDEDEDEDDEDEDDEDGFFARIGSFIANMSSLDHVVVLFGCFILMGAVATGLIYAGAKMSSKQVEAFAEIGSEMEGIGIIGESGLLAVSNAESARLSQMMNTPEAIEAQEAANASIEVIMNINSIQSDIKIKFVDKRTNKLIRGIPFEVEVTGDNGKTYSLKDDDKDGIIYQTGVNAGTYTIKAAALTGEEYEKYVMPSPGTIKVTDTIAYKKVDVADEIKTEAEVNVAIEDTAKQDTVVESTLTDTVEWVESTRTEIDSDSNYEKIEKSQIPDPATIGRSASFVKLAAVNLASINPLTTDENGGSTGTGPTDPGTTADPDNTGGDGSNTGEGGGNTETPPATLTDQDKLDKLSLSISSSSIILEKGKSESLSVSISGEYAGSAEVASWTSSDSSIAAVSGNGNLASVTAQAAGSAAITATVRLGEAKKELSCSVTVKENEPEKPQVTDRDKLNALNPVLNKNPLNLNKGASEKLSVTLSGEYKDLAVISWKSDKEDIAKVDGSGNVTAISGGTATVTATISIRNESTTIPCTVNVTLTNKDKNEETLKNMNPALNTKTLTVSKGGTASLTISRTGTDSYKVEWSSDDKSIASVDGNGLVKGEKNGDTKIKAKIIVGEGTDAASMELVCDVKVTDVKYTALKIEGVSALQVGKTGTIKGTTTPEGGTVAWTSDNEKVVKIDSNGTMTGVAVGTATITGTCGDAKNTWKVTVTKDVSGDTTTKLKTKDGKQIYVKNSEGKYVEATYADYYKDKTLYLRRAEASYSYTGWQTIDGSTYFFDKHGNYVTGDQVIQGAKYSFGSDGRLSSGSGVLGIDVSKWNGSIDWNAVKNSGISYVIIRCGYRGSSTGALIEDPKFKSNIQGAKNAGLKVGVYFFSQAVNEVEAVEEASMAINLVSGYGLNYPIFLDVESSGGRGDQIDAGTRTAVCKAFCNTIQNSGYSAGVYANKTWFTSYINTASLTGYKIWLAQYAASPSYTATRYDMWQYSSKGKVTGINGNVDMNISYLNY